MEKSDLIEKLKEVQKEIENFDEEDIDYDVFDNASQVWEYGWDILEDLSIFFA